MAASQKNAKDALAQSTDAAQTASRKEKKESVYSAEEFVENAEDIFQTKPECVQAALRENGITECTKTEAKNAVEKFMKKEVK